MPSNKLDKPLPKPLREALRALRLDPDKGKTYRQLAALIGVSKGTVCNAERGRSLDARTYAKIERFLEGLRAA